MDRAWSPRLFRKDSSLFFAGGHVRGAITVDGHPKDQATFNRVSGYVEQVLFKAADFCAMQVIRAHSAGGISYPIIL